VSKLRAPVLIVLTLVLAPAAGGAVLAPAPTASEPDFIDTILASKAVVAAIRLAIVFAAVFLVLSVVALTAQQRWLVRLGPVEVSDEVSDLSAENQRLKERLKNAFQAVESLERSAASSQRLINREKGS
jgi:uncharacterized protein YlxW (UPF0749 family)